MEQNVFEEIMSKARKRLNNDEFGAYQDMFDFINNEIDKNLKKLDQQDKISLFVRSVGEKTNIFFKNKNFDVSTQRDNF